MLRRCLLLTVLGLGAAAPAADAAITVTDARAVESGEVVFTLTRETFDLMTVNASTANGTAVAGQDYTALTNETVSFSGNTATVRVATTGDAIAESEETFTLRLTVPIIGSDIDDATGTIADPALSVADTPVLESQGVANVPVTTQASARAITFSYATAPGSATQGADFTAASGEITIPANATAAAIPIQIPDDTTDEDGETFTVTIAAVGGTSNIAKAAATVTIGSDNDFRFLTVADAQTAETDGADGAVRVPVTLDAPTFRTVTAQFATVNLTARSPADYRARVGTVTIPPGQTQGFIDIQTVADDRIERNEQFAVLVGRQVGAGVRRGTALVTVVDDDALQGDDKAPSMKVTAPKRSGRSISLKVTCPKGEQRCTSRVTLYTRPDRTSKARSLRRERRIGGRTVRLNGGRSRTVKLTVPRSIASAARRAGRLKVRAFVVTEDASENQDTTTKNATLRFRR